MPPELETDELTLLDLAQWVEAIQSNRDDITLTEQEKDDIDELFSEILLDEEYAEIKEAEGVTDPPTPRITINWDKLRRLRDRIKALRGRLWERLKEIHKRAVEALIDSLLQGHPIPPETLDP